MQASKHAKFIAMLPKAELHLHLEGAIPWYLVRTCSPDRLPPEPVWWRDDFVFQDFAGDFTEAVRTCYRPVLSSADGYYKAAAAIFAGLIDQNVRYVEMSFAPRSALARGIPVSEVVDAIKSAVPADITVCVIAVLVRDAPQALDDPRYWALLEMSSLDGWDICGDERKGEVAPFAGFYARAHDKGLQLKAHAGELLGPQAINQTLDCLKVKRLSHGVTAAQDEALMDRLIRDEVTLDVCPTSNVKLRVARSIESHPIRALFQRGVGVTVNTDDPTIFGCSLSGEMHNLIDRLGFSLAEVAQIEINAFRVAHMPESYHQQSFTEIRALLATL